MPLHLESTAIYAVTGAHCAATSSRPGFPLSAAIHALTVGAIGTMILAVMTRATRGHTGRELHADGATTLIYALMILSAAVRIGAALAEEARADLLLVAAGLWVGAFGLFALRYAPLMLRPRTTQ